MLWAPRIWKTLLPCATLVFCPALQAAEPKTVPGQPAPDPLASLRQTVENCAAVSLYEDFHHGTSNWKGAGGARAELPIVRLGFVSPGRLALYQPSLGLTDYEVRFLGTIDHAAVSWVVRAADAHNYYVVKLVLLKAGPVPKLAIRRYAVIGGIAFDRVETPFPLDKRTDSYYHVSLAIQADRYVLTIQDQLADSWTEGRLKHGGVGFFTDRGERSRISSLQITHQDDLLGRLCAHLAQ
jgi:hypothetical protein